MSLPVIELRGPSYEQGLAHGRALKDEIAHNVNVYFDRFKREVELEREEVLARARLYLEAIQKQNADYYEGIRGIASGSSLDIIEIAALNVRYEILYYEFGLNPDGCTAFAVSPQVSANGHLLMGQNWDWIPQVAGAVVHGIEENGLEVLSFTEAGIFGGKIGLNSAGLGLAINGLTTTDDDWSRLVKPFHLRCYEILRKTTFEEAIGVVTGTARACSTNFLIAQTPDNIIDIEAAPDKLTFRQAENGVLAHTNHFLEPDVTGIVEPPSKYRPHSCHRHARMRSLLQQAAISVDDLKTMLRDHDGHPNSVCRHPDLNDPEEDRYMTVTSVIMDLDARELLITDGPPCENAYTRLSLA